jgi:Putative zinc-finger
MKEHEDLALKHFPDALLIRALDDELAESEGREVESHLAACEGCRRRYQAMRQVSASVESALAGPRVEFSHEGREGLERELERRETTETRGKARHTLGRLSFGMAIAAALAFALLVVPQWKRSVKTTAQEVPAQPSAFEVDGESFVALPYSNPDLPLNSSYIVQMQVPVASLADAGIVFEPISNEMSAGDRSVLADVLLGIDGRPLGIHVLTAE